MRTGISYLGHQDPKHLKIDLEDIKQLGCDDLLLAAQENDFEHMTGKLDFTPKLAKDLGIRPLVIFWGLLNLFGGGKSSQLLLRDPHMHQVQKDGSYHAAGCYNNPACLDHIKNMIDRIAACGFLGYFIDEPTPIDCYCPACCRLFEQLFASNLHDADTIKVDEFRKKCVVNYIQVITEYIKRSHPQLETLCCIMPEDKSLWSQVASVKGLDNLGTDIYWVNEDVDVEQMTPLIKEISQLCRDNNKKHHQWLQAWGVKKGREARIKAQGEIIIRQKPDALYAWAYQGQIGTQESSEDPETAWAAACEILKKAKSI